MSHTDLLFQDRRAAGIQPRPGAREKMVGYVAGFVRRHGGRRGVAGSLPAETMRDIGARRDVQDYAATADLAGGSNLRLHRIAETVRWTSPQSDRS